MEDFKYLGNESGASTFPILNNLDVQKTQTQFNWSLWTKNTKLYLKHVPALWASDYQHVVAFDSAVERDNYLLDGDPHELETEFRIPHDGRVRLPLPYDELINYNYISAVYPDAPVPGYNEDTTRRNYYYFIEDCEYIAPNTTELTITLDVWTTYQFDIEVQSMLLERGHLPMTYTNVDDYLENPILNINGLLTTDVNFGDLLYIPKDNVWNLYDDNAVYVVATTANPTSFTDVTTTYNGGQSYNYNDGLYYFAVEENNWSSFCSNIMTNCPAFLQTISGIIAIPAKLLDLGASFTFGGVTCYETFNWDMNINYDLTKSDFKYDARYDWITKLYTSPYAMVEIIDHNGVEKRIKVEELYVGSVVMRNIGHLNIANPLQSIILLNVGGSGLASGQKINFDISFPSVGVNINPQIKYLFETIYPRLQRTNEINLAKEIGDQNALVGKQNSDANALLASNISSKYNEQAKSFNTYDKDLMSDQFEVDNDDRHDQTLLSINNTIIEAIKSISFTQACAEIETASTAIGNLASSIGNSTGFFNTGLTLLNATGGGLKGALTADVIKELTQSQLNNILQNLLDRNGGSSYSISSALPFGTLDINLTGADGSVYEFNRDRMNNQKYNMDQKTDLSYDNNEYARTNTKSTANANTNRDYNNALDINAKQQAMALAAIQNAINQSALGNNTTYGSNGDNFLMSPDTAAIHYHVITQSPEVIKKTADYFLMFGYSYNDWIQWTSWNVMRYYTYWKCKEIWLACDVINNKIVNEFKAILSNGVMVWSDPQNMGNVSIYSNVRR